ncbi:MAG: fatty acid desaturase [Planctomycetaceae bacterium]
MCEQTLPQDNLVARLKFVGRFVAFPLFAIVGYIPLAMGWPNDHWLTELILVGLLSYSWFCVGGLSHELVHGNLKTPKWFQHSAAHVIGTFIGIPLTVYRESHLRHHAYLNTPLDNELWPYSNPRMSLGFRRIFVWFDVLFGIVAAPLIYGSVCFHRQIPLRPEIRRRVRFEYSAVVVFWTTTVVGLTWAHRTGLITLTVHDLIFIAPLAIASSMNSLRKLTEHLGMSSYDPVMGTRTVIGDNVLTKLFSYFDFDLAVHGPHHRHPRLPHTQLADRMREFQAEQPDAELPVYSSFAAVVADTVRCMIRNPGVGVNAGGHTDLAHLPGLSADSDGDCVVPVEPTRRAA